MKKNLLLTSILALLLTSLLITNNATTSPSTVVGTQPRPSTSPVGTTFDLNITITEVTNLYAWEFNMTFNATILRAENVVEGEFLQRAGTTWMPTPTIDNENGYVFAGCSLFPYPEYGADGNGQLAAITFSVQMKGKCSLDFTDTKLRSWDPINMELVDITHTAQDGFFRYPLGDVNGDGFVNIQDISQISAHWYPGPPPGILGYDPNADLNLDGNINIQEISIISAYWTGPPKGPLDP